MASRTHDDSLGVEPQPGGGCQWISMTMESHSLPCGDYNKESSTGKRILAIREIFGPVRCSAVVRCGKHRLLSRLVLVGCSHPVQHVARHAERQFVFPDEHHARLFLPQQFGFLIAVSTH